MLVQCLSSNLVTGSAMRPRCWILENELRVANADLEALYQYGKCGNTDIPSYIKPLKKLLSTSVELTKISISMMVFGFAFI